MSSHKTIELIDSGKSKKIDYPPIRLMHQRDITRVLMDEKEGVRAWCAEREETRFRAKPNETYIFTPSLKYLSLSIFRVCCGVGSYDRRVRDKKKTNKRTSAFYVIKAALM